MPPILIISYDGYEHVWPLTMQLIYRYWDPFPTVHLLTEEKSYSSSKVNSLKVGKNDWSTNLRNALHKIDEKIIVLVLDDFLINRNVDVSYLESIHKYMKGNESIGCIRIWPIPEGSAGVEGSPRLKEQPKNTAYRVSTQAALWRKDFLMDLIEARESPWEFEHNATKRAKDMDYRVLTVDSKTPPISYYNSFIRGKMTVQAKSFLDKEGITFDQSIEVMSIYENYYWLKASNFERHAIDFIRHRFGILK